MTTSTPKKIEPKPIQKSHEQSLADEFNKFLKEQAEKAGRKVTTHSLDGDDRDVGADYVLSNENRFAIVEFKWTREDIKAESYKTRRLKLCKELSKNSEMTALHDSCHFVSWGEPEESNKFRVFTNIYRFEVCTKKVFGDACCWEDPSSKKPLGAANFARRFIQNFSSCTLSKDEFNKYLAWVKKETSSSRTVDVELITGCAEGGQLVLQAFTSISEMTEWVKKHSHQQETPSTHSSPRIGGRGGKA